MKRGLFILLSLAFLLPSFEARAQCAESLNQAQQAFDDGHLYGIPALLGECVDKGSKQDKIEAYRLLTLTYLYIDDPIGAQKSFMSLLKLDPEYRVDSTNHIELVHLSKEFITTPIVSWSARGGVNVSNVSTIHVNGSYNTNINNEKYDWAAGGSLIGTFEVHLNKIVSFRLESDLSYNSFRYTNNLFDSNGEQNSKDVIKLHEKSLNYALPISIKLTYPGETYYPYVYAGYSPNYTFISSTNAEYINIENGAEISTKDVLNIAPIREDFSQSLILGIGLMRRINYNYVFVDVRYKIGMSNRLVRNAQNDFENHPDINKYTFTYLQQDNDFRQNELSITAGYVWPKYKPRKRKSVTAKSFFGNMFKKKDKDE